MQREREGERESERENEKERGRECARARERASERERERERARDKDVRAEGYRHPRPFARKCIIYRAQSYHGERIFLIDAT